jgi:hypothetical protein
MCKKDQVNDIFRDVELNNEHFYTDSKSYQRYIQYRFITKAIKITIDRITCIISLKLAKGILYSQLILKRTELYKKQFLMEIDSNEHVYLYGDLSQR